MNTLTQDNDAATDPRPLDELTQQGKRIQALLEKIAALPDPAARTLLQECMQSLLGLYGAGLERILQIVSDGETARGKVYDNLIHDNLVRGLLLIHGLHPVNLETRLREALGKVRPYLETHGGDVELVGLANGIATLRLQGTCKGCPSSAMTLELAIKQAIEEACPDLLGLEVEGVVAAAEPRRSLKPGAPRWTVVAGFTPPAEGEIKSIEVAGVPVIVCKVKGSLYAYRNLCPACGLALETGALEDDMLRCRIGHRYDVRLAGGCPDNPEVHLDPFPLLPEGGGVKVAVTS